MLFIEVFAFFVSGHQECLIVEILDLLFSVFLPTIPPVFHLDNSTFMFYHLFTSLNQAHFFRSFYLFNALFLSGHYEALL